ncbi:MAG: hypothetical protein FWB91_08365 [Defluviitaleaceae bacterium]|nr:hypothetical protein [Defluviitaleaceae bacterium]
MSDKKTKLRGLLKTTALTILLAIFLSGCGRGSISQNPPVMPEPPVRIWETLEEQFDRDYSVVASTRVIPYPTIPTQEISFTTPDRFSISYALHITVEDPNASLEMLVELPGETGNLHFIFADSGKSIEATLFLEPDAIDFAFHNLFAMGIVEESRVTVWDMSRLSPDNDEEHYHARWSENNTISITFIEN